MVLRLSNRRGGNDTRAGPLLPERARSECARSTAAVGPTQVPFPKRGNKRAWREHVYRSMCTVKGTWTLPLKRGIGNLKALARANGTFRRASGWAGENAARSRRSISRPRTIFQDVPGPFNLCRNSTQHNIYY